MIGRWLRRWVGRQVDAEVARVLAEQRAESPFPAGWESGDLGGWTQVGGVRVGLAGRCGRCGGALAATVDGGQGCPWCEDAEFPEPPGITRW